MADHKFAKLILKGVGGEEEKTPEQKAEREAEAAKRAAEHEKHQRDYEESVRLAVPRDIAHLRKEAAEKLMLADQLEKLLIQYPNLRKQTDRWKNVRYYSKDVNTQVARFEIKHSCGCCNDSPLLIYPYIETPDGRVYADPPKFSVGEKEPFYGGDVPYKDWDQKLREAGIPELIIGAVKMHFRREADGAKEHAARIYDQEKESNEDEPLV